MPSKQTNLSELKENQYFKLGEDRGSKRFKFLNFSDNQYYYLDSNEKRSTPKDKVCYVQTPA